MTTEAWAGTALAPGVQTREASAFLARVAREQTVFLDALSDARRRLQQGDQSDRQLVYAAATHARLTRQFFDAQRALLRLRAEADRDLAEIAPVLESFEHAMTTPGGGLLVWEAAEAQLAELLDHWWRIESDEAKAAVDDASARAAMRSHLAEVEAPAPQLPLPAIGDAGPSGDTHALLRALDAPAGTHDLDALLTSWLTLLDDPAPAADGRTGVVTESTVEQQTEALEVRAAALEWAAPQADDLRFVDDGAVPMAVARASEADAFEHFWSQVSPSRRSARSFPHWLLAEVLLPVSVVVSVLVLALAWIG